eukprot:767051-Hanusia_phi.AAC.6
MIQFLLDNNADTELENNEKCKPGQMSLETIYENAFDCCKQHFTETVIRYLAMDWIPPNLVENEWKLNMSDKKVWRTKIIVANGKKTFQTEELQNEPATENIIELYTGKTILMYAAEFGMLNVVKFLLKLRADPSLKDASNKDALVRWRDSVAVVAHDEPWQTCAIENKHFEIAHYINNRLPEELRQEILDEVLIFVAVCNL